jgi:hypothetical protein
MMGFCSPFSPSLELPLAAVARGAAKILISRFLMSMRKMLAFNPRAGTLPTSHLKVIIVKRRDPDIRDG